MNILVGEGSSLAAFLSRKVLLSLEPWLVLCVIDSVELDRRCCLVSIVRYFIAARVM